MSKKSFIISCLIAASLGISYNLPSYAGFKEHYVLGQQHFFNSQYSSAIDEFKKALMINFLDNSARIGLTNSYLARGTYIANYENNYKLAADDFRSAIFYLKYYVDKDVAVDSISSIASAINSLHYCEKQYGANTTPAGHYKLAEELNNAGNFPAAMYEYEQIINIDTYRKTALLRIASMMKSINNLLKSSEYYRMALECDPNDISARMRYASVLDKMGNTVGASEQYNYVLAHSGDSAEILYDLERIYQKKLETTPNNAELLADIGAIKQRQGKYAEAYNYYKQSQNQPARNEETKLNTQINMGTLLQVQGNYDKAIETYKNILTLHPSNYQANLYLAQCYEAKQGCEKLALEQYRKLKQLKPDGDDFKDKINELTRASMTPEEILTYVKSVVNPDKSYLDELYNHAITLHDKKDYDNAIRFYSAVKNADPARDGVYENLAICYAQKKDYTTAQTILEAAKKQCPNNPNIAKILKDVKEDATAEILSNAYNAYNSKNYSKALELYSSVDPQTTDSLLGIAGAYQGLNQTDKALEYYKKALHSSPTNSDIAYSIGAIYANSENYTEARKYFEQAVQLNPSHLNAKDALLDMKDVISQNNVQSAAKLLEEQKYDEALVLLNKSLADNPQNADAYFYRASVYDAKNKHQLAINDYKKSLQYNSNQDVTYYLIAIDYENMNNVIAALEYYKKFLNVYKQDDEYSQYVKARIPEIEADIQAKNNNGSM
ncbi:MAG: tetratricopeptide repeat protein [Candidatus Gastranaerophilales bacterium]|nr:tetratricopeptide repeat protein [Candidatus Gastranaerophilales bacterium]